MALVSPGVEVTIIDESQYASARINTVPYILIATAENKVNASGTDIAPGTISTTDDDVYLITSQRELVNTFGNPFFYTTSGGNSINGYELNEYGLMAAYSVLGATNRAYIQRADIDLASITASSVRPAGDPLNGSYWLDLSETEWGIFVWNAVTNNFTVQQPILITSQDDLDTGVPKEELGQIGDYAVVTYYKSNPVYRKNSANAWTLAGSDSWKLSMPTIVGDEFNPTVTAGHQMVINSTTIISSGTTLATLVGDINVETITTNVEAREVNQRLELYTSSGFGSGDSSADVSIEIEDDPNNPVAGTTLLADIGIAAGIYNAPIVQYSSHTQVPRWRSTDTSPRPTGSVWIKTTAVNEGVNLIVKRYDTTTNVFTEQPVPLYVSDAEANKWLDPARGGKNIEVGDTYAQYDVNRNSTGTMSIFSRSFGETSITGELVDPVFVLGDQFEVAVSLPNDANLAPPVLLTIIGTTASDFVALLLSANLPYLTASVTANSRINITHTGGGVIHLSDTLGGAVAATGINAGQESVRRAYPNSLTDFSILLSNWNVLDYSQDLTPPGQDPLNGTNWYYSAIDEMDIMINNAGMWDGYTLVDNDIRGYDLRNTNPDGPMLSFIAPDTQDDGSPLEYGDLWIDSSDLETYPKISRWELRDNIEQWVSIDTADSTTTDGLIFADARWANNGDVDPITDELVPINVLNKSLYVDPDAPDPSLYPEGILLFNTRRSGYNVKEFRVNYFNPSDFGNVILPSETNAWVTVSGNRDDGRANMGRHAQRSMVVQSMREAIDTSENVREEARDFNLMATPNYPELIPNMVALNNERKNLGFIIGDSPMRLPNTGAELVEWASNNAGLGTDTGDGLVSNDEYLGVWYPSAKTNDLSGQDIVVPPSHMMLRTIIHSDEQSYPWFAPAGVRRGQVDNATALGFIDAQTGEFQQIATRQGVRDVLYQANVNPITFLPGSGITNYGNKTTQPGSALDRVNVARLVNYIRKQLEVLAKPFLFEPNDEITRNEIKNVIESLMNDLVSKRGLYDYSVVCDKSNNTPFRIDRNELWVDIAVEPVKSIEFIYIPVRIKNTGEISGG